MHGVLQIFFIYFLMMLYIIDNQMFIYRFVFFLENIFQKKVGKCLVFMKFVVPLHSQTRNKDTRKLKHGAIAQMVRAHDS